MRAKLKCIITSTQKSLNKDNEIKSPKFKPKSKLEELTNTLTYRGLERENK